MISKVSSLNSNAKVSHAMRKKAITPTHQQCWMSAQRKQRIRNYTIINVNESLSTWLNISEKLFQLDFQHSKVTSDHLMSAQQKQKN